MKIFYDKFLILEEVEIEIDRVVESKEEKEELWNLVDEIVNHRILESILDNLPKELHHEFLEMFHEAPHDEGLIVYLKEKVEDIEEKIKNEVRKLSNEILSEIKFRY